MKKAVVMEGVDPDGDEKPNESKTKAFGAMFDSMVPLSKDKKNRRDSSDEDEEGGGQNKRRRRGEGGDGGRGGGSKGDPKAGSTIASMIPFFMHIHCP